MPHKRAKRSVREQQRFQQGIDLAPARSTLLQESEPLPKAFLRALNADKVRAEFRAKRKLRDEGGEAEGGREKKAKRRKVDAGAAVADVRIRPGESLAHFNKRIETDMRPLVRDAVQVSRATERAARMNHNSTTTSREKNKQKSPSPPPPTPKPAGQDKHAHRATEFARTSTSAPRRLNDIAMAPPDLSSSGLARRAGGDSGSRGIKAKATAVLSPAQALQMAAAREQAIARYRDLKATRRGALAGGGEAEGET